MFAAYGGLFAVAAVLAWMGYHQRARLPGFNRWHLAAVVAVVLGCAAVYAGQQLALAMRGAITG